MPRTRRALAALPDLSGVRLACDWHIELKMIPVVAGLLGRGAALFVTSCSATTVRPQVAAEMARCGAIIQAAPDMAQAELAASYEAALDWGPTHLCEIGADLSLTLLRRTNPDQQPDVRASLEATGTGINRLAQLTLPYPLFNWDDLPVKEGLHNRHMVGLTTWQTFFQRTRLSLHEKQVLVVGYGLVGRGLATTARAFGGRVMVTEVNAARRLEAAYAGWPVLELEEALPVADVVVTATGAEKVIAARHLTLLRDGVFLLNAGHLAAEIDVGALRERAGAGVEIVPFVHAFLLNDKTVYLLADGAMVNLTAGPGDSLNAFDVTLAVMVAGIGHIVTTGQESAPGVHLLPRAVWETVL
ncbi:MAG: NAD(P)-dependent oxidoreductase [Candidatus Promineifilaceae bacterium]|nr:NAD(P)-dependent oxidoreductase [Candidatus Promineifilaceae bacterium]